MVKLCGFACTLWILPLVSMMKSPTLYLVAASQVFADRRIFFVSTLSPIKSVVLTGSIRASPAPALLT